jgi:L-fucose mutarotase
MGHGDTVVIADANFPATSMGQRSVRLDGVCATKTLEAVLSLLPLDTFITDPAKTMQVVGDPETVPDIVQEFQALIDTKADAPAQISTLDRFAFYEASKAAYLIIQTGETRLYGNIILTKGVIS